MMKKEFSSIEVKYLIDELKQLEDSKIDRVYQPEDDEILLQLHKTGKGKMLLRIKGKLMYLASQKPINPQTPFGFCIYLRKKISGAIIKSINQMQSERIVEISLQSKEGIRKLIIELFGSGNVILADENDIILSPMSIQRFKDREIKPKEDYSHPERGINIFEADKEAFFASISESQQNQLVKALALDLGMGGTYAEELCLISGIEKSIKPDKADDNQLETLFSELKSMLSKKPSPRTVLEDGKVIDIIPFEMEKYKDYEQHEKDTFNQALDSVITGHLIGEKKQERVKTASREMEKVKKSLEAQEKSIKKLKKDAEENHNKGEAVYEKYELVSSILRDIRKAREKHSWKEIKEKLKGHKVIKEINEKEGKVVIEI
ncbi:hypothetical protein GF345_01135 [Candidatus Woesearchaeota archaeon]|nr:hypothetical protein [Candidatus Woesearchaeota archaeon]